MGKSGSVMTMTGGMTRIEAPPKRGGVHIPSRRSHPRLGLCTAASHLYTSEVDAGRTDANRGGHHSPTVDVKSKSDARSVAGKDKTSVHMPTHLGVEAHG